MASQFLQSKPGKKCCRGWETKRLELRDEERWGAAGNGHFPPTPEDTDAGARRFAVEPRGDVATDR